MEELTKIQVDSNKLNDVVKVDKELKKKLAQQLVEFFSLNQNVFV